MAAVRRSGRYPRLAVAEAIPRARRPPDLRRMVDVAWAEATACGEAFVLRVAIFIPEEESEISMTLELANPEYLCECRLRRFPGSLEKIGPSGTRFTVKELYLRRRSHWRS